MNDLDERQQQAVRQLQDLTNAADGEVCRSVLASVDWDVQQAADMIFGQGGSVDAAAASSSSSRTNTMQTFDIDDSQQDAQRYPPFPPTTGTTTTLGAYAPLARPLLTALALPLHILASLVRFVLNVLRIPFPHRFASFGLGGFGLTLARPFAGIWTTGIRQGPSTGAGTGRPGAGGPERWVRELEEETGAVARRRGGGEGEGQGGARSSAMDAGSAGVSIRVNARSGAGEDGEEEEESEGRRRYLPEFVMCSYEEMLRRCQQEARIGCVVLVSDEHDDVKEFKRSTLTDLAFVDILHENNILVWGGDVRDRDAWSASEKLQATTYPFVAFVALQPRRTPSSLLSTSSSSSSSAPTLTVLSRHQGPCIPSSAPTSATTLTHHLSTQLVPRVTPFLARMRNVQRERERERELRLEQDRAFEAAARRDKERIERKMREEREAREAKKKEKEEERRREEERERREGVEKMRRESRMAWRRWTRRAVVRNGGGAAASGNGAENGKQGLRVAIRLPSGARVVHTFDSGATLTTLYAIVDAALIPPELSADEDPISPPEFVVPTEFGVPKVRAEAEMFLEVYILACDAPSTSASVSTSSASTSSLAPPTPQASSQAQGEAYWGFHILSSYPRVPIPWSLGVKLSDVEQLRGGGQVVVEIPSSAVGGEGRRKSGESVRKSRESVRASENGDDQEEEEEDDGYDTEESE